GGSLTSDQRFASGELTPTLEAVRGSQLERGFGMSDTLGARAAAERNAAANRRASAARASALAPGQDLDDYLSRLTGLANPYGTSTTNSSRSGAGGGGGGYAGPSPTEAGIMGGLGAGLSAWGAFQGTGASRGGGGTATGAGNSDYANAAARQRQGPYW
ncbi:MAG TPA: hypothetical protein VFD06_11640, partial [Candidatus Polarisedimenticolia bacterium]|nr:hypothetical protein [Candidatus Polarisedimenticolia bacterium]